MTQFMWTRSQICEVKGWKSWTIFPCPWNLFYRACHYTASRPAVWILEGQTVSLILEKDSMKLQQVGNNCIGLPMVATCVKEPIRNWSMWIFDHKTEKVGKDTVTIMIVHTWHSIIAVLSLSFWQCRAVRLVTSKVLMSNSERWAMEGLNLVQLYGENVSSCGYCLGEQCSTSLIMEARRPSVQVYELTVTLRCFIQFQITCRNHSWYWIKFQLLLRQELKDSTNST